MEAPPTAFCSKNFNPEATTYFINASSNPLREAPTFNLKHLT
jgi:hypothetical protein